MTRHCSSCGNTNIALQAKFCTQCGNALTTTTTTTTTTSTATPKTTSTLTPPTHTPTTNSKASTLKAPVVAPITTTTSTANNTRPTITPKTNKLSQSTGSLKPLPTPPSTSTTTTPTTTSTNGNSSTPPPLPTKPNRSSTVSKPLPTPTTTTTSTPSTTTTGNNVNITRIRATTTAPKPVPQQPTATTPSENFMNVKLKSTKINNGEPINTGGANSGGSGGGNRPKANTVSLVTLDEKPKVQGSFVKMAIKSRDEMDNIAQRDNLIINGEKEKALELQREKEREEREREKEEQRERERQQKEREKREKQEKQQINHKKSQSAPEPPPKKRTSSAGSTGSTTPLPPLPTQPSSENVNRSIPLPPPVDKEKEAERERQRQAERDEREKQRLVDKEKMAEKERAKKEEKDKEVEREKQRVAEREKIKREEKDEKERQRLVDREKRAEEKKRQRTLEKEKKRTLKIEKDKERERRESSSPITVLSADEADESDSSEMMEITSNGSGDATAPAAPVSPKMSFSDMADVVVKNKDIERKKKEREKYNTSPARSRFFSFILGNGSTPEKEKDGITGSDDDFVISSPVPSSAVDSNGDGVGDGENCASGDDGQPQQLRKWAIKRNELNGSKGDLMASVSPTLSSVNGGGNSSLQLTPQRNSVGSDVSGSASPVPIANSPQSHSSHHLRDSASLSKESLTTPAASSAASSNTTGGPNGPPNLPDMPQATDQRSRVIEEIIVTERDYIRDLEIMVWMRKEMIGQDDAKGQALEEINILFSNVEQLVMINHELYKKFIELPTDSAVDYGMSIANAFISLAQFLKSYFVYCSNQQKALSTFSNLRGKNCSFLGYLLTRRECRSLPFDSFLIKPVQRVCKYPLLIRELIKSTPDTMKSYPLLQEAQKKIESIVSTVNEKKREFDGQMRMCDIQTRLTEGGSEHMILSPSRKLIKEGEISSWGFIIPGNTSSTYNKKPKVGYYYLFNDLFVYAQPTSLLTTHSSDAPLKMKAHIPLDACFIREREQNIGASSDESSNDSFELLYSCHQIWWFQTETPEEMQSIFTEISQVIDSNHMVEYKKYVEDREKQSKSHVDFDEWRKAVKNKPLPEPPKSSTVQNSESPKSSTKALPSIPTPNPDLISIKVSCHHLDPRQIEISKETPTLKILKEKIQLKFSLDNLDFTVQSNYNSVSNSSTPSTYHTIQSDLDLQNIVKSESDNIEMKIIAVKL